MMETMQEKINATVIDNFKIVGRSKFESMNLTDIIARINADNFVVIDDHTNKEYKLAGVGLYCNASGYADCLVAMADARYYSTNSMYIGTDNKVHLSKSSAGPTVFVQDGKHLVQEANDQQILGSGIAVAFYADGNIEQYELGRGTVL